MNLHWRKVATSLIVSLSLPTVAFASTTYTVQSGDTLWSIANRYHTSVTSIESQNHLHSSMLHIGQKLTLDASSSSGSSGSSSSSTSVPSGSQTVTVQSGDSLWSIAHKYGVSVSSLEGWNGLTSSSVLHVGERLHIGGGTTLAGRSESAPGNLGNGIKGAEIANYAERFVGAPYRWGGESPAGFDCSGLVQFSFGHFGVSLSRTSYGQYQAGYSVREANLIPGDLVFFNADGPGASHVGIYVGGGEFVNAAGWQVQINSLYDSYWNSHFIGAKRVV